MEIIKFLSVFVEALNSILKMFYQINFKESISLLLKPRVGGPRVKRTIILNFLSFYELSSNTKILPKRGGGGG